MLPFLLLLFTLNLPHLIVSPHCGSLVMFNISKSLFFLFFPNMFLSIICPLMGLDFVSLHYVYFDLLFLWCNIKCSCSCMAIIRLFLLCPLFTSFENHVSPSFSYSSCFIFLFSNEARNTNNLVIDAWNSRLKTSLKMFAPKHIKSFMKQHQLYLNTHTMAHINVSTNV